MSTERKLNNTDAVVADWLRRFTGGAGANLPPVYHILPFIKSEIEYQMKCNLIQYNTLPNIKIRYNRMRCNAVQYYTIIFFKII